MKNLLSTNKNQSGVGLLEALIAVALSSIIILGGVYSMSRMLVSQQQNNLQYIVINDLRAKLQGATAEDKEDWCKESERVIPEITHPKEKKPLVIRVTCKRKPTKFTVFNSDNQEIGSIDEWQPIKFEIGRDPDDPLYDPLYDHHLGGKVTVGEALE